MDLSIALAKNVKKLYHVEGIFPFCGLKKDVN